MGQGAAGFAGTVLYIGVADWLAFGRGRHAKGAPGAVRGAVILGGGGTGVTSRFS